MATNETFLMSARRPEVELLLHCARTSKSSGITIDSGPLLRTDIDWEYLLRMSFRHGVVPLVYSNLSGASAEAVPKHVLGRFRDRFHANRLRSLQLTGELLKLLREFEARKVPAIPYKGPVLAASAYGDLALREFGDLDVLIRKRDVLEAKRTLTSLGYKPHHHMTSTQEAALLRYDRQYPFVRGDGNVVELHWTPTTRSVSFMLDPERLWEHTRRIRLGGGTVSTFGPEDTILILCIHGCSHLWERLGWICDVAELVRASVDLDWEWLVRRADACKTKRTLLLGLFLASDLLGVVIPEDVLREARADATVQELAAKVRGHLFSESPQAYNVLKRSARWRFHLRMLEHPRDRLRYCIHRATTPTQNDWEFISLPVVLFPCYRLLRPVRLGGTAGRRLAERLQ
jgi:hypothetical protein